MVAKRSNSRATMKFGDPIRNPTAPVPLRSPYCLLPTFKSSFCTSSSQGANSRKRVKFVDVDYSPSNRSPDDSPSHLVEGEDTRSTKAKTSEYAFFKKFKQDAGLRFDVHAPPKNDVKYAMFKSSGCFREKTTTTKDSSDIKQDAGLRFDVHASPKNEVKSAMFKSSGCFREKTTTTKNSSDFKSFMSIEIATPINYYPLESSVGDTTICSGNPLGFSDVFYRKRQKLRQYATDVSFPGIDEKTIKGDDFVSLLLSRLIPVNRKHYKFEDPFISNLNIDTNSNEPASSEKLQWLPERNFIISPRGTYFDNDSSNFILSRSRGRTLLFSESSTISDDNIHLESGNFDGLSDRITLWDKSDSAFCFPVEERKSDTDTFSHFNEDGTFSREQNNLLLGWTNEEDNSHITHESTELNRSPKFLTLQSMDNNTDAITLHSSFLSPRFRPSSLHSSSLINFNDFESETMEEREDITPNLCGFLSAYSSTPEYGNLTESYTDYEYLPQQSSRWVISESFNYGRHLHHLRGVLSSSRIILDFGNEYSSESGSSRDHYKSPNYEGMPSILTDERLKNFLDASDFRGIFFGEDNVISKDWPSHYWDSPYCKREGTFPAI